MISLENSAEIFTFEPSSAPPCIVARPEVPEIPMVADPLASEVSNSPLPSDFRPCRFTTFPSASCPTLSFWPFLKVAVTVPSAPIENPRYVPLANPFCELEETVEVWLTCDRFGDPSAPYSSQVRFMFDAPPESPEKVIPVMFVEGVTRFPFESKVREPIAGSELTGSWITSPDVVRFEPLIVSCEPVAV